MGIKIYDYDDEKDDKIIKDNVFVPINENSCPFFYAPVVINGTCRFCMKVHGNTLHHLFLMKLI